MKDKYVMKKPRRNKIRHIVAILVLGLDIVCPSLSNLN